jgi:hypothetical protein
MRNLVRKCSADIFIVSKGPGNLLDWKICVQYLIDNFLGKKDQISSYPTDMDENKKAAVYYSK